MTSTVTEVKHMVAGNAVRKIVTLDVTSYATGGETLPTGMTIEALAVLCHAGGGTLASAVVPAWDKDNGKLKFLTALNAEVAATSDLGIWYLELIGY